MSGEKVLEGDINVLAFDGGGSRGLMEAIILDNVMNLASSMYYKPEKVLRYLNEYKEYQAKRSMFIKECIEKADCTNAQLIHPTEVFNYIAGTSTGSLIAFALVGGKKSNYENEERCPMSVSEVIEMYKALLPNVFQAHEAPNKRRKRDWALKKLNEVVSFGIPLYPYSIESIAEELAKQFDFSTTDQIESNGCIAGAVTLELNQDTDTPDVLKILDSYSTPKQVVYEVLAASCDAPVCFNFPRQIDGKNHIDGGLGGNCPLACALDRIGTWPNCKVNSVLSIAPPPAHNPLEDITPDSPIFSQQISAFKFIAFHLTNGAAIYEYQKRKHPDVVFRRVTPLSEKSRKVSFDESEPDVIAEAAQGEVRNNNLTYLNHIISAASIVFCRKLNLDINTEQLCLLMNVSSGLISSEDCIPNECFYIYNEILKWSERFIEPVENVSEYLRNNKFGLGGTKFNQDSSRIAELKKIEEKNNELNKINNNCTNKYLELVDIIDELETKIKLNGQSEISEELETLKKSMEEYRTCAKDLNNKSNYLLKMMKDFTVYLEMSMKEKLEVADELGPKEPFEDSPEPEMNEQFQTGEDNVVSLDPNQNAYVEEDDLNY